LLAWYAGAGRDLPWRRPGTSPWAVLVSEVMLQQTPVARVLPAYAAWLARWPTPTAQAADPPGEAVRQWGGLGYPRRALRLHAAAGTVVARHGGALPDDLDALQALPGVGAYTARALSAFAFRRRVLPLDTNVRRVLARAVDGRPMPRGAAVTGPEQRAADALLAAAPAQTAAGAAAAVMELGALVCTSRSPRCPVCPLGRRCTWRASGFPVAKAAAKEEACGRRRSGYAGTDREARGALLAVLRDACGPVDPPALAAGCPADPAQRERALHSLIADGLVDPLPDGRFALPA
jgi:A/G-specific adenine glycosylase